MKTLSTITILLSLAFLMNTTSSNMLAQPGNDHIMDAINLGEGPVPFTSNFINFPAATFAGDATPNPCAVGVAGVWFNFTATSSGLIEARLFQPNNPVVVFFEGPMNAASGLELTYVDQVDNPCDTNATAMIDATAGNTYYIFMKNDALSEVKIETGEIFQAPPNDLVENATNINGEPSFIDNLHFLLATNTGDGGQIGTCNTGANPAVWYKFTAQVDGEVNAEISLENGEGAVIFYSAANENATNGTDLTYLDQATNACNNESTAQIQAIAGTTYYLLVTNISGSQYFDVTINLENILGVHDDKIEGLTIFPNPTRGELNVTATLVVDNITILNMLGQVVYTEKIGQASSQLDLSNLQNGIYIVNITAEGSVGSYKLIKN